MLQKGLRPAVVRLYDELDTLINSFGHTKISRGRRDVRAPVPPIETGALPAWPEPRRPKDDGVVDRLIALAKGKGLRDGAMHAALGNSELVNKLFGTVAEKIARRGCRLVIGLEGARIRTEVEAALTFAELESRGRARQGRGSGLGVAAASLRGELPDVAGVPRRRVRRHDGGRGELGAARGSLSLGAQPRSAATPS